MNRRNLLKALPAVAVLPALTAVPALGLHTVDTPVMRLYREWEPLSEWLNGPEGSEASEVEFDRINAMRIALEDQMMAEPAQGVGDVLAKMLAWTHYGEDELMCAVHLPQVWAEARALVAA